MKREYHSPELDLVKFSFENMLEEAGSDLIHSKQQGYGEGGAGNSDGDPFG